MGVEYKSKGRDSSTCHANKIIRQPRNKETEARATERLDRGFTDVKGPNRLPTGANGRDTPYKLWYGEEAELPHLREIGCKAFVYKEKPERDWSEQ